MRSFRKGLLALAAGSAAIATAGADAAVRYDFVSEGSTSPALDDFIGGFSFVSRDFLRADTTVSASRLAACQVTVPANAACTGVTFRPDIATGLDALIFSATDTTNLSVFFYFASDAFTRTGVFTTDPAQSNPGYRGTLTVSGVAAVPETATWAMMAAGFGLVGMGMRRRTVRGRAIA